MNNIGIIGNGFVGNAIHQKLKNFYNVMVYDSNQNKSLVDFKQIDKVKVLFICVPTPTTYSGNFDLSIVKQVISSLSDDKILIIKSTVTPSAAKNLVEEYSNHNFVFNPEFLTERTAVEDFKNPSRIVLGSESNLSLGIVEEIYKNVFPEVKIIKTNTKTACFIKYFSNCFFAAKVSLMNEFRQVSDKEDINWETAIEGLLSSGWVNPMHTQVPGPDGDKGFGGKCFPKDIVAFIEYSKSLGIKPIILESAWEKNLQIRNNLDWLNIDGAIIKGD